METANASDNLATSAPIESPPGNNSSGAPTIVVAPGLAEKIERAAASAVDQHISGAKKRGRGERGPDKKPRRPRGAGQGISLADMDQGPGDPLLEEGTPVPLEGIIPDDPPFDEKAASAVVDIALGLLNDCASGVTRFFSERWTGDKSFAEECSNAVVMSGKTESAIRLGGNLCAKKYSVKMESAPEWILVGGVLVWAGTVTAVVKTAHSKGKDLRENPPKEKREAA